MATTMMPNSTSLAAPRTNLVASSSSSNVNSSSASSSSNVLNVSYETFAPRGPAQVTRLNRLASLTAGPTALAENAAPAGAASSSTTNHSNKSSGTGPWVRQALQSPLPHEAALYEAKQPWNALEGHRSGDDQQDALRETLYMTDALTQQWKHTTSLRLALRASINIAEDISNRHAAFIRHSGELSAAADRLQEEEALLTRHAQEIGKPLQHYDAVDRIGIQVGVLFKGRNTLRGLAKIKVDHEDFPTLLDDIDKAVEFFGRECGGPEALEVARRNLQKASSGKDPDQQLMSGNIEYYRRAVVLQEAALALMQEAVADRITNTATQIANALNIPQKTVPADQLEASLIYTRFHGISSRSNRLLGLAKARLYRNAAGGNNSVSSMVGDAYAEFLQTCRTTYCTQRQMLLLPTVRAHMDKLRDQHGPVGMTRLASVFLIRFCTVETSLYLDFFGDNRDHDKVLNGTNKEESKNDEAPKQAESIKKSVNLMDDSTFKDATFQNYLTTLCSALHRTVRRSLVTMLDLDTLCQIVAVLREERSLASSSPTTMAAARAISSVIEDAQERLIFCANNMLTKEVVRFKATPSDLDYPDKLMKKKTLPDGTEATTPAAAATAATNDMEAMEKQLELVYESWFPPVRSVLRILAKIFRVVEPKVFEDMALQSVQACTACLHSAANYIRTRKGTMDSDLFLVKHLLILREQLSPFDIELRSVERQLDFSDAGKAVARFLANRNRRLFSMKENALLALLREGVSVQEAAIDSKRDLEDALRHACNDFIEHTSRSVASDLLQWVEKCGGGGTGSEAAAANDMAQEAMLRSEYLSSLLTRSIESVEAKLPAVTSQMALYMENPGTQSILLKPVSRKLLRAVEELRKHLLLRASNGEAAAGADNDQATSEPLLLLLHQLEQSIKKTAKAVR